jgi:hypothetical protein
MMREWRHKPRLRLHLAVCDLAVAARGEAQNRGVYPVRMAATTSGVTFPNRLYVRQPVPFLLARSSQRRCGEHAVNYGAELGPNGHEYSSVGEPGNAFCWNEFSVAATLPFANNSLESDLQGHISGGRGFADSYDMPFILGWNRVGLTDRFV